MTLSFDGKQFNIYEEDAQKAMQICSKEISHMLAECDHKGCLSFVPIYLLTMRTLCESMIGILGMDGLLAAMQRTTFHAEAIQQQEPEA